VSDLYLTLFSLFSLIYYNRLSRSVKETQGEVKVLVILLLIVQLPSRHNMWHQKRAKYLLLVFWKGLIDLHIGERGIKIDLFRKRTCFGKFVLYTNVFYEMWRCIPIIQQSCDDTSFIVLFCQSIRTGEHHLPSFIGVYLHKLLYISRIFCSF